MLRRVLGTTAVNVLGFCGFCLLILGITACSVLVLAMGSTP